MKVKHETDLTIFDVLQSICVLEEDLQVFMKSYKVLQITGIIIHPLTKVKEVSLIDNYVIVTNITNVDLGIDNNIQKHRTILGLNNLGNTCFLNSSLQAIINCKEFSDYFYSRTIKIFENGQELSAAFSALIKKFDYGNGVVSPCKLKNILASKRNIYIHMEEQDAMEFITDFLDLIHEELKIRKYTIIENIDRYKEWKIENQSIVTT